MSGDHIQQYGAGSIGKAEHSGSGDIVAGGKNGGGSGSDNSAVERLLQEVEALKRHLDESDQAEVDAAAEEINTNPSEGRFRELLKKIAGIATVVGEAGVPVILAVKALLGSP